MKIRFVEICDSHGKTIIYLVQRKTIFGWRYIKEELDEQYGGGYIRMCHTKKSSILKKINPSVEYPSLKQYL